MPAGYVVHFKMNTHPVSQPRWDPLPKGKIGRKWSPVEKIAYDFSATGKILHDFIPIGNQTENIAPPTIPPDFLSLKQ